MSPPSLQAADDGIGGDVQKSAEEQSGESQIKWLRVVGVQVQEEVHIAPR